MGYATLYRELNLATNHEFRQVILIGLRGDARTNNFSAADDRNAIGDLQHLIELVANENNAMPLGGEAAQDCEDFHRFLGCEYCSWLIEDEYACIAIECFEDLHPLLPANRKGFYAGVRVDFKTKAFPQID